jgi:hypothetical protein
MSKPATLVRSVLLAGCAAWLPGTGAVGAFGAERPLVVKARIKQGPTKDYETRILDHLEEFRPGPPPQCDKYGGWMEEQYEATGFFYAKKIDGRWWLIDPEGHRFLHVAVNSVRAGQSPQNRRAFPGKFGTDARWRDATVALLREHGFNGTGCWSDDELLAGGPERLVYTPTLRFMSGYGKRRGGTFQEPGHTGYPNRCIFAFDPQFEAFADELARPLAQLKDDPYLLGYFSDNEMPFPNDSLDRYLQLAEDDPGHKAAQAWLAQREAGKANPASISDEDRKAWLGHLADRYFGIVGRAIKRYDPNHLYLGSRFHASEKRCAEVWKAAGRYVDVISVNVYGTWTPEAETLQPWAEWSGRPLLVTEWYAKGDDSGLANNTGAGWTVATQQERGWFYQNFTLALLESRVVVGWHWFKYMDNDPEDLSTDPSNRDSNKGIVTTSYEPYRPLLDAMKPLNRAAYALTVHFDRRR